jgi:hypothetical protein
MKAQRLWNVKLEAIAENQRKRSAKYAVNIEK